MSRRLIPLTLAAALLSITILPASSAEICKPVHHVHHVVHHVMHHHVSRAHAAARLAPCTEKVNAPEHIGPGYNGAPGQDAYKNITGKNGSPCYRAADEQRSFAKTCGIVYHRFFDEYGAYVDRAVRICN